MAYPVIPFPEGVNITIGSTAKKKARSLTAEFGGGYVQRAGDGINAVRTNYSVVMENLTKAEGLVIDNFLTAQAGYKAFLFTKPGESTPRKWICQEWEVQNVSPIHDTLSAEFIEVFDP